MSRIKQPNFKVTTNNAEGILLNSLNGGDIILSANTGSMILSAPSGATYCNDYSANYSDRSLVDKGYVLSQISSLTGNTGGVTGATNGLSLYNNNCIGLGGSLNGNTCINLDSGYLYLRDATEDNTITLSYYAFDASYSDGTSISRIYVESGDVWLNSINNSTNNMSMICVIPTKLCLYATEANNDICSNIDIAYNTIQISSYSGISSVQNVNFSGITYAHNYSENYTDRSLVDKGYVLSQISGFTTGGTSGSYYPNLTGDTNISSYDYDFSIFATAGHGLAVSQYTTTIGDIGNSYLEINQSSGDINMVSMGELIISSSNFNISFDNPSGEVIVSDYGSGEGLKYSDDYSANYTDRSLVDKAYVLSQMSGGSDITGATNGLSLSNCNVGLGGALTESTIINFDTGSNLMFSDISGSNYVNFQNTYFDAQFSGTTANSYFYIDESGVSLSSTNDVYSSSNLAMCSNAVMLYAYDGDDTTSGIVVEHSIIQISSYSGATINPNFSGMTYGDDYSANYTDRSLVDKAYVLSQMSGGVIGATNGLNVNGDNYVGLGGVLTGDTVIYINDKKLSYEIINFNSGTGFDNFVWTLATQTGNTKIIVSGEFTSYSGVTANRIIGLNSDGTIYQDFLTNMGSGFNAGTTSLVIQDDNKILVGGYFSTYKGVTANRLIRLNSDGSIDNTFITGTGFGGIVWSLAIQDDGKILAGGQFVTYSGVTTNKIIRLNSDGSIDNTFVTGTGFNEDVWSLAIQDDGKILVGGQFSTYSGVTANSIIRLNSDGSIDNTFVTGTGFNNLNDNVYSIVIQDDGEILVGGQFSVYSGVTANGIIRLNSDGGIDNTFISGIGFEGNTIVMSLAIQTGDTKIVVGGYFTAYSGVTANRIIRLNSDGSIDNTFVTGTGFNGAVISNILQLDNKILVGGQFSAYSGVTANGIIRLNSDGSIDNNEILLVAEGKTFNYGDDYSAYYTDRSLVDKEYVDNKTSNVFNNIDTYYTCTSIPDSGNTILVSGNTSISVSLPITSSIGKLFKIKDISGCASVNNIIINSGTGRCIDGSQCAVINTDYGGFELQLGRLCNWYIMSFVN